MTSSCLSHDCCCCPSTKFYQALFGPDTKDAHRLILQHVRNKCLDDPLNSPHEYQGADGKTYAVRGTSQLESLHRVLRNLMPSTHLHPRAMHYMLLDMLFSYSVISYA